MSNTIRGVLLVDDEPIVLKSAKRLLERKKFKVFVANTGSSAISVFQENRDQIGAILLDLSMPDMDGEEILEKLIEVDAAAKVILFSGYARSAEPKSPAPTSAAFLTTSRRRIFLICSASVSIA